MTHEDFASLAVTYLGEVTAYARRLTRSPSDADDLVQDTYDRAFGHWQTLRELRSCRAWLFRIARNLWTDRARSAAARPELWLVADPDSSALQSTVSAECVERLDARELEAALRQLPPEQREAVLLCDLWGFSYGEIAEIMACPLGTVQSRIARGRTTLVVILATETAGHGKRRGS